MELRLHATFYSGNHVSVIRVLLWLFVSWAAIVNPIAASPTITIYEGDPIVIQCDECDWKAAVRKSAYHATAEREYLLVDRADGRVWAFRVRPKYGKEKSVLEIQRIEPSAEHMTTLEPVLSMFAGLRGKDVYELETVTIPGGPKIGSVLQVWASKERLGYLEKEIEELVLAPYRGKLERSGSAWFLSLMTGGFGIAYTVNFPDGSYIQYESKVWASGDSSDVTLEVIDRLAFTADNEYVPKVLGIYLNGEPYPEGRAVVD